MNVKQFRYFVIRKRTLGQAINEFKEILEARTLKNFKEETSDFCGCLFLWLDWDWLPLPKSFTDKIIKRRWVWMDIFWKHNLEFKNEYLYNGSNYNKPEKVKMALDMARKEQS